MEKILSEGALQGDLESLRQILEEDSLILDRIIVYCISETPLIITDQESEASIRTGLERMLAAAPCGAKGHVTIVDELLRADAE